MTGKSKGIVKSQGPIGAYPHMRHTSKGKGKSKSKDKGHGEVNDRERGRSRHI